MGRTYTHELWLLIMGGKIMVMTSVSLSLTGDDVPSHSHNTIGSKLWLLLLFLARVGVFSLFFLWVVLATNDHHPHDSVDSKGKILVASR